MTKYASPETNVAYTPELRELIDRAQQSDETALPELRELLDGTPELWQQIGDLVKHVETAWIKLLAGNDLLTQESLQRECQRRRAELLGDDPTPIERYLVEMIVTSWLQLKHAEIEMANSAGASEMKLNFLHKRLESAQKQHSAAIDQLVKVREVARATEKHKPIVNSHKSGREAPPRKGARRRVVVA